MEDWEGPSEMAQGLYSSKFGTGSISLSVHMTSGPSGGMALEEGGYCIHNFLGCY